VGTFRSGANVNLTSRKEFGAGTSMISIRNIKPMADLRKKAPYPVGLKFTALDQSAAQLRIQAKQISKTRR
jgi:hypothetical protein